MRELIRFLEIAFWYRKFVFLFSQINAALINLLKKKQRWERKPKQQKAFIQLKTNKTEANVLACSDFLETFSLQVDASDLELDAAFIQNFDRGDRVIVYASCSLSDHQKKYSATKKECLTIVWAIQKMRLYIKDYYFIVESDHQFLKWLMKQPELKDRLVR